MPSLKKNKPVRAATLADVGRAAGVSAMAASTVLNGAQTSSRIAPDTRERIIAAAAKLRYRPNAAARALANRRMDTLGVATVIEGGELNSYFLEVFNGIMEAAALRDQNVTVFALHDWRRDPARLHNLCDGRIDGLILIAPTLTRDMAKLLPEHTPFVALHPNEALPNVVTIETDEERGAYELVNLLIAQGHRRIMHMAGPPGMLGPERRIRGYQRALAESRIPFVEDLLIPAGFDGVNGGKTMRRWLKKNRGGLLPQAIFCVNDAVAVGCLEVLAEAGLKVPDDISVVGFDDTLAARTTVPQLTTVRQPLRAMGGRAVEIVMSRIEQQNGDGRAVSFDPVVFPVELVHRASLAAPAQVDVIVRPSPR